MFTLGMEQPGQCPRMCGFEASVVHGAEQADWALQGVIFLQFRKTRGDVFLGFLSPFVETVGEEAKSFVRGNGQSIVHPL